MAAGREANRGKVQRIMNLLLTTRWCCMLAWAAATLAAVIGCGKQSNVVPVSGRVVFNGQPLADVAVNFGPVTGGLDGAYAAYGKTGSDGRYALKLVDNGRRGATVGKNRVTLNESGTGGESDGAAPKLQFKLPPSARDGTLMFEVPPGGTDAADFEFGKPAG